jgi:hypothetical protein
MVHLLAPCGSVLPDLSAIMMGQPSGAVATTPHALPLSTDTEPQRVPECLADIVLCWFEDSAHDRCHEKAAGRSQGREGGWGGTPGALCEDEVSVLSHNKYRLLALVAA